MGSRRSGWHELRGWLTGVLTGVGVTLIGLRFLGVPLQFGLDYRQMQKFFAVYQLLSNQVYWRPSSQKLVNGAVEGMVKSVGDPFTDYMTPTAIHQFMSSLSGLYDGIGVTVESVPSGFRVVRVTANSPAASAQIKSGSVIVSVNGTSLAGKPVDEATSLIMGPPGTYVTLGVKASSDAQRVTTVRLKRAKLQMPSVYSKVMPNHIGYMQIITVGQKTSQETKTALRRLQSQGAKSLIIDLRDNGGGLLDQAEAIASQLIPKGKAVLYIQYRGQAATADVSTGPGTSLPMVVLINQYTASAAEVLAAALHDDTGAPLVGTRSYGKGSVQETQGFYDGSAVKYTVGRWLTPTHYWVQHKGLQPTDNVQLPAFVSLVPLTFGYLPLKEGQNTPDVSKLQQALRAAGYAVDRTDGYFDASTKAAVLRFQAKQRLPGGGAVNQATATALGSVLGHMVLNADTQLDKAKQIALRLQKTKAKA